LLEAIAAENLVLAEADQPAADPTVTGVAAVAAAVAVLEAADQEAAEYEKSKKNTRRKRSMGKTQSCEKSQQTKSQR
jgi:hypothetical protein